MGGLIIIVKNIGLETCVQCFHCQQVLVEENKIP